MVLATSESVLTTRVGEYKLHPGRLHNGAWGQRTRWAYEVEGDLLFQGSASKAVKLLVRQVGVIPVPRLIWIARMDHQVGP